MPSNPDAPQSPAKEQFMSAASRNVEASRSPEKSLWKGGYSPKAMYGSWIMVVLLTVAAVVLTSMFAQGEATQTIWMVVGAVLLLMWCWTIATFLYRRVSMRYELTTERFVHQSGILLRTTDRIEVIDIDDVTYTQGIIQRMLGVGTIVVSSSDRSHPLLHLHGIDRVPEIANLIDDVRREERRRRSVHIDSV